MATRPKKQHYVPQFLLRRFASGSVKNPKIWVLDKTTKAVRLASVRDVAHENAFYEYSDSHEIDINAEPLMDKLDSIGARIIGAILKDGRLSLPSDDRVWLSYFVACQLARTPTIRKDMEHFRAMVIKKFGRDVRMEGDTRPVGDYGPDDSKYSSLMLIRKDVPGFAELLREKAWFLVEAPSGHSFIISDSPVTRYNMVPRPGRGNLGLKNAGIEVYIPLSPRYALHIVCPRLAEIVCFSTPGQVDYRRSFDDGWPVKLLPENVEFVNSSQVIWAERWVFTRKREDMALPLDMLRTNPELMYGPGIRQRPEEVRTTAGGEQAGGTQWR